ncbi:MAG: transglycosylase domain-containing protein [Flavobacteriales bacterium]|nr:transglycosylase domain-containing protein [Flavobacteriales bacterium]
MAAKRRKKKAGPKLGRLLLLLMLGVVLCLGLLIALVSVDVFGELPSKAELAAIQHEEATLVLARDGTIIGKLFAEDRTNIRYEDIPPHLMNALVSTEDARFFAHQGVDGASYLRVFFRTILGGDRSGGGGSTISQQIIKNLYGREDHGLLTVPVNKIKEALVAQRLEQVYDKQGVLVLYLNSVPFGENTYGIEAAARRFFGKSTARLKVEEGAVLVGMLKANTSYNPRLHPEASRARRNTVLELLRKNNLLTTAAADSLKALPIAMHYAGSDAYDVYGYFVDRVGKEAEIILRDLAERTGDVKMEGIGAEAGFDLRKDGLRIYTTLDPELQHLAADAAHEHLARMQPKLDVELKAGKDRKNWERGREKKKDAAWKRNARTRMELYDHAGIRVDSLSYRDSLWHYHRMLNAAVLMMEPATGAVRAWVGGNHHRYLALDLVRTHRPIASTIKPFLYAAAIEAGLDPCTYLENTLRTYPEYDDWTPQNFDGDTAGGQVAMWYALARSMNLPTVDLYFRLDQDSLRDVMRSLGLPQVQVRNPAICLGASDLSLEEVVPAYGAFAYRGQRTKPRLIEKITDAQGKVLYEAPKTKMRQAISRGTANVISSMLRRAVDQGTGAALRSRYGVTVPLAGKTGTSQDQRDAWFFGYTPGLVVGTWVGAREPSIHFRSSLGTGGQLALPIAGAVFHGIEASAELRGRYIRSFAATDSLTPGLDCPPRRDPNAVQEFFEDLFDGRKEPGKPVHDPADTTERKGLLQRILGKERQ